MTAWQLGRPCQSVFSKSTNMSTNPPRCVLVCIVDGFPRCVLVRIAFVDSTLVNPLLDAQSSGEKIASRCRKFNPKKLSSTTEESIVEN